MATTEFIAAIELSSSKISGIAGKKNSDGSIQVLAYAREDAASFIHKGVIYNIDKTAQALTSIINKLESQLNNSIAKVYVGIGGQSFAHGKECGKPCAGRGRDYLTRVGRRYQRRKPRSPPDGHECAGCRPAGI